jgi:hypothetical protein
MSAPEGKTDVPREPGHFRFGPISEVAPLEGRCNHVAEYGVAKHILH